MIVRLIQMYVWVLEGRRKLNFRKDGMYMYLYSAPEEPMGGNLLSHSLYLE